MTPPDPDGPVATTEAQARTVTDVLGWGAPRPAAPDGLATALRTRLDDGLTALGAPLRRLAATRRAGCLTVSRSLLQRAVCDGWLLAPEPYVHTAANVRGVLGRAAILADLADERRRTPADVAAAQWHRMASDRPGDPRSIATWMNRLDAGARTDLQAEVGDLVAGVREVWPLLPEERVELGIDTAHRIPLADGAVELVTTVDLTVTSRVADGRARRLVVDLRTGQPRAPLDRLALRFATLCATLADAVVPFRWSSFYVTEGRFVSEDLPIDGAGATREHTPSSIVADEAPGDDPLVGVVDRVVATVATMVELADVAPDIEPTALRLAAGPWCASCRRREACPVAAAAR